MRGSFALRLRVPAARSALRLLRLKRALYGEVDTPLVAYPDDLDLHGLAYLEIFVYVTDIGVGHLRNMYKAALAPVERDKRAEFGDTRDFPFQHFTDRQLHVYPSLSVVK